MTGSILITGGAGFIGSHVVRAVLSLIEQAGCHVVVLDDLSGGFQDNVPSDPRVTFIRGSITDVALVKSLFERHRFRFVYHLAAYAAEGLSHFIRGFNYTNNLLGSVNLINASVNFGTECFVFTSSIAVYGPGQVPMREDLEPQPEDPYGIAKYAVELDLRAAHTMFGLDSVIFRPHNVYGEYQTLGDKYRNVVGIFMNQILRGEPMTIFGDGEQSRAFTYIGDVAPVIAVSPLVPAARNRVFNVGADEPVTVNALAVRVAEAMGVAPLVVHLPARREVLEAYSDHSASRAVFEPAAPTALPLGLQKMAEWVRLTGARTSRPFENIEVSRNLPPSWT